MRSRSPRTTVWRCPGMSPRLLRPLAATLPNHRLCRLAFLERFLGRRLCGLSSVFVAPPECIRVKGSFSTAILHGPGGYPLLSPQYSLNPSKYPAQSNSTSKVSPGEHHRNSPHRTAFRKECAPILDYERASDPKRFYRYTLKPVARSPWMRDLKPHELRHTFATLILGSGAADIFEP